MSAEESEQLRVAAFKHVISYLRDRSLTWGDLVEYISDPANHEGHTKFRGFFTDAARVQRVLNHWVSWRNGKQARANVHEWIMNYIKRIVRKEGNKVTKTGTLQSRKMPVNESFVAKFNLSELYSSLRRLCPTLVTIMESFSWTTRQKRSANEKTSERKQKVLELQSSPLFCTLITQSYRGLVPHF